MFAESYNQECRTGSSVLNHAALAYTSLYGNTVSTGAGGGSLGQYYDLAGTKSEANLGGSKYEATLGSKYEATLGSKYEGTDVHSDQQPHIVSLASTKAERPSVVSIVS